MSNNYFNNYIRESYPVNNKEKGPISFSGNKSQIPTPRKSDYKTVKKIRRTSKSNRNIKDVIEKNPTFIASKKETKIHSVAKESPSYTQVKKKTIEQRMNDKINTMQTDIGEMKANIKQIKQDIGDAKTEIVGAINNLGVTIKNEIRNLTNVIIQFLGIAQSDNKMLNKENVNEIKMNANDSNKTTIQENNSNKLEIKLNNKGQKKEDFKMNNFQYAQVINLNRHIGNGGLNSNSLSNSGKNLI